MGNGNKKQSLEEFSADLRKVMQDDEVLLLGASISTEDEAKDIKDRLYKMIDYAIKRHDWYTDQCHRLLQIGLALMASGAAILGIFAKIENFSTWVVILGWLLAGCVFGVGFELLRLYTKELAKDHPYRKLGGIKSWYFSYNFPEVLPSEINEHPETAKNQVQTISKFRTKFFEEWLSLAKSKNGFIREDLEQVSILMLLQRYRLQQVKAMRQTLFRGMVAATFLLVLLALCLVLTSGTSKGEKDPIELKIAIQGSFSSAKNQNAPKIRIRTSAKKASNFIFHMQSTGRYLPKKLECYEN